MRLALSLLILVSRMMTVAAFRSRSFSRSNRQRLARPASGQEHEEGIGAEVRLCVPGNACTHASVAGSFSDFSIGNRLTRMGGTGPIRRMVDDGLRWRDRAPVAARRRCRIARLPSAERSRR
jgi:hypothetical protein